MPIFHLTACLQIQHMMKLVSYFFLINHLTKNILLEKMKQYLEQLRKECSDRMVDRVIDPETDKPSKVIKHSFFLLIKFVNLVVALFCSSSFYG